MILRYRYNRDLYRVDGESNAYDAARWGHDAYLFCFGSYGDVRVAVFRSAGLSSLDDCLEAAASALADEGMRGIVMPHGSRDLADLFTEAREELSAGGAEPTDEEIHDLATRDLTYTEAGYLTSYEWGVTDLRHGSRLYGNLAAVWLQEHPDWTHDEPEEIEAVLRKAGAADNRIRSALDAIEAAAAAA